MYARLQILPGKELVVFLVGLGNGMQALTTKPEGFVDGLKAANDLLSFSPPESLETAPEELFPWTGNV
jgi:hypothetical protein